MRLPSIFALCVLVSLALLSFSGPQTSGVHALSRRKLMKMKKLGALALLLKLKGKKKVLFALPIPIPIPLGLLEALKKGKKDEPHMNSWSYAPPPPPLPHHHYHHKPAALISAVTAAPLMQATYQPLPIPFPLPPSAVFIDPQAFDQQQLPLTSGQQRDFGDTKSADVQRRSTSF